MWIVLNPIALHGPLNSSNELLLVPSCDHRMATQLATQVSNPAHPNQAIPTLGQPTGLPVTRTLGNDGTCAKI